jgi:hypothetical protein
MRFVSYLVRPGVFLVFGLALGYCFGYSDAFRDSETIGSRVSQAIHKVDPEAVRAEQQRRAAVVRDSIRAKYEVLVP